MKHFYRGFTLIETLLVLVIISMILYSAIGYMQQRTLQTRLDKTSIQMQQILNAGLSYYVANNKWPANLAQLQGKYLPPSSVPIKNPWGQDYVIDGTSVEMLRVYTSTISVSTQEAASAGNIIAGMLPLGYATSNAPPAPGIAPTPTASGGCGAALTCYIVASVNIPGQNLNNARAINFAGLYKHGACVPRPTCPVDTTGNTMTPQIFVAPVQVAGTFDDNSSGGTPNVYPISSFSAYAKGPSTPSSPTVPPACDSGGPATPCDGGAPGSLYWRVCMQVVTERGVITSTSKDWGRNQTIMALTRCVSDDEPAGSGFGVFTD